MSAFMCFVFFTLTFGLEGCSYCCKRIKPTNLVLAVFEWQPNGTVVWHGSLVAAFLLAWTQAVILPESIACHLLRRSCQWEQYYLLALSLEDGELWVCVCVYLDLCVGAWVMAGRNDILVLRFELILQYIATSVVAHCDYLVVLWFWLYYKYTQHP